MAEKRMFAKSIVQSTRFMKMPVSSRELYFQMGISADDDGVVEAWNVMQVTKANEDDLRVLVSKGFVQILDNEELIAYLTDWETNNTIRSDRYHEGPYKDLKIRVLEMLRPLDNQMTTNCQPSDNQVATNCQPNDNRGLGLDSGLGLDKEKIKDKTISPEPTASEPVIASLILQDGTVYKVTQSEADKYKDLYRNVNVEQELRHMQGWCDKNPAKRKTSRGIGKFITTWLSKADKEHTGPEAPSAGFGGWE